MRALRLAWLNVLAGSSLIPAKLRVWLYRLGGVSVGDRSGVLSGCYVGGDGLTIGADCFVNRFVRFDAGAPLIIEDNVFVGFGAMFITSAHDQGPSERRAQEVTLTPITVGAGSWIGAGAIILPGVTIGPGCIVAAGSVVNADTKPDTLVAGVPAVHKKHLF